MLDLVFGAVLMTFAIGWTWAIADARASQGPLDETTTGATASIGAALTDPNAPSIAYLTDATINLFAPLRGESGRLRAVVGKGGEPIVQDSLPAGATLTYSTASDVDSAAIDSASTRSPAPYIGDVSNSVAPASYATSSTARHRASASRPRTSNVRHVPMPTTGTSNAAR